MKTFELIIKEISSLQMMKMMLSLNEMVVWPLNDKVK